MPEKTHQLEIAEACWQNSCFTMKGSVSRIKSPHLHINLERGFLIHPSTMLSFLLNKGLLPIH